MLQLRSQVRAFFLQRSDLRLQSRYTLRMLLPERYCVGNCRHYLGGQLVDLLVYARLQLVDPRVEIHAQLRHLLINLLLTIILVRHNLINELCMLRQNVIIRQLQRV